MHKIYGWSEGNAQAAKRLHHERYLQIDESDCQSCSNSDDTYAGTQIPSKGISPEDALEAMLKLNKMLNAFSIRKALNVSWRAFLEDFGKQNVPGKRARRPFSQLSEFERGLIIGMKTAGWSMRRVASQCIVQSVPLEIVGSSGHEKVPKHGKPGLERPGRPRGERIEGSHLAEANLKSKPPFRALPLTPEHRQLRLQLCQARSMWHVTDWQKVVFSDESRFVFGTDDNRVRVWRRPWERYNPPPHTVLRLTARTAGVMVWGHTP
ncbi:transposable element Tc1 transposase [Trichonephila clavipes]|nr:transposable element Tc1 transposase [Trichonephila clavipes]